MMEEFLSGRMQVIPHLSQMNNLLSNKWLILIFRFYIGAVFIYAGVLKIIDPIDFASQIQNYQILPYSTTHFFAILLPWVEVFTGTGLILGIFVDGSSFIISGMMVVFILAISQALLRGLSIECGCFGKSGSMVGLNTLFRDIFWFLLSTFICFRKNKSFEILPKSV